MLRRARCGTVVLDVFARDGILVGSFPPAGTFSRIGAEPMA
jgi:hypothetical protein